MNKPEVKVEGKPETAEDIFEQRFSDFLESDTYDKVEAAMFDAIREAYTAGWRAAAEVLSASGKIQLMRDVK